MSAAKLAEFEAYRKQQNLIGIPNCSFEKQLKKSADPLYDPAEFLQTQGQIQAAFQGHQIPDMNPSMVSAISLVEAMAADVAPAPPAAASSGPPAVLVTREKSVNGIAKTWRR
ncbi:MAG: hypothetical protein JOS17DRAFT_772758 [Linnemannia elongata]|nr:MAG: hypothetical protein JOS17DRAFT_772758 [Linnemannia elongata]